MDATEPVFTFAEVLAATGAENTWLRTLIQRDRDGRLGKKHRTGRLLFSLNHIMAIGLMHRLNAGLRVAPAAVWEIFDSLGHIFFKKDGKGLDPELDVRIGFDAAGRVLVWTRNQAGHIETWNDHADDNQMLAFQANNDAHIVIPIAAILLPTIKAFKIAKDWPEGDRPDRHPFPP